MRAAANKCRPAIPSLERSKGETVKHALVNGQLTSAIPDAPATATCPGCGDQVKLRQRQGTYFWRHVELPFGGCHPANPESVVRD